jgi:hypothetical protein
MFVSTPSTPRKEPHLNRRPVSRPILLLFAIVFLFETWVWDSLTGILAWIAQSIPWARIKRRIQDIINRLPAIFAVLLFGVPLVVMEFGAALSVVTIALGHVILGSISYAVIKLIGVSSIAVIYDLTQEKLMTLGWFVWLHRKFERLHEIARDYVAPYRDAARAQLRALRERVFGVWQPGNSGLGRLRRWVRARKGGALTPDPEFD